MNSAKNALFGHKMLSKPHICNLVSSLWKKPTTETQGRYPRGTNRTFLIICVTKGKKEKGRKEKERKREGERECTRQEGKKFNTLNGTGSYSKRRSNHIADSCRNCKIC